MLLQDILKIIGLHNLLAYRANLKFEQPAAALPAVTCGYSAVYALQLLTCCEDWVHLYLADPVVPVADACISSFLQWHRAGIGRKKEC